MEILIAYLIIMNAAGLVLMCLDKLFAKKKMWRIPESTLMCVAAFGGSLGSLAGMYLVRHKTRHKKFSVCVPAFLIMHIVLLCVFCRNLF